MNVAFVLRITAILLLIVSGFMLVPIGVAAIAQEWSIIPSFLIPMGACLVLLALSRVVGRKAEAGSLSVRSSYLFVTLSWILATALGAAPLVLSGAVPRPVDAYFEIMSGFTTTGATVIPDVEILPRCILMWRSLTHWLGGMGIVVLTVALFPLLGMGGARLLGAESPGPSVDKITPRITGTAKILWIIYTVLTALQVVLLTIGGMDLFDATTHAFGTMATGGFSTRNASVGHFRSAYIDAVTTVFMILAAANFTHYFRVIRGQWSPVWKDTELRVYLGIFAVAAIAITVDLMLHNGMTVGQGARYASFQAASVLSTTGFVTADFGKWPAFSQIVLLALMFIGGCSGSTGGGIKVVRLTLLFRQAMTEMRYLIWPRGVFAVRLNGRAVRKNAVYGVYAFVFLYLVLMLATTMVVASGGYDITTSLTATLATLGNIGPGFGLVGPVSTYVHFPDYVKVALTFAMIVGRLEIYTVLLLLTPSFWRK